MSRPTVARRLTAVLALLAILCLATPAMAAPGAQGQAHRTRAVQASSLVDQLFAWIGGFWTGPAQEQKAPAEKTIHLIPSLLNALTSVTNDADKSGTIDPNG